MSLPLAALLGLKMDEYKQYNDATKGNGDWPSWRRLVLSQLESLDRRVSDIENKAHKADIDREVIKARIAFAVVVGTLAINAALAWVLRKLGI